MKPPSEVAELIPSENSPNAETNLILDIYVPVCDVISPHMSRKEIR